MPLATLTMMDKGGTNRRHLAAVLALVFGSAQANVVFPMSAKGLNGPLTLAVSAFAAIVGAAATYHLFARKLEHEDEPPEPHPEHASAADAKGVIDVINRAGREAFDIAIGSLPMLVLSLLLVNLSLLLLLLLSFSLELLLLLVLLLLWLLLWMLSFLLLLLLMLSWSFMLLLSLLLLSPR